MFEGRHPTTGEQLGRPHGRHAVPAFDVVLRPTKSVSILYGSVTWLPAGRCWPPTMSGWPKRSHI
jgi:TrwC relaxase